MKSKPGPFQKPLSVALALGLALLVMMGGCFFHDYDQERRVDQYLGVAVNRSVSDVMLKDELDRLKIGEVWMDSNKNVIGFSFRLSSPVVQKVIWYFKFKDHNLVSYKKDRFTAYL